MLHSPLIINGFDDESKRWTDCVHVFIHDPLDYCCLAGIIQPTELC